MKSTPKKKVVRAWIWTYPNIPSRPIISFDKPTKTEIKNSKEYEVYCYPCEISYYPPEPKKK